MFSCEYWEIFKNSFFLEHLLFIILFRNFVTIEFFGCLWLHNWHFSHCLCHCFVPLHNFIRISVPWLFRSCFYTKIFSKCNFCMHYNVGSSTTLFRSNSRITVTSPSNLLWKTRNMSFLNVMLCYYFSLEAVL